jgi:hypothetical protein
VADRFPNPAAAELVQLKVDVIVVIGTRPTQAAKNATQTIPIVMTYVTDPVGTALVASLAHPGGNVTGLSNLYQDLGGKQLELLKEGFLRFRVWPNTSFECQSLNFLIALRKGSVEKHGVILLQFLGSYREELMALCR